MSTTVIKTIALICMFISHIGHFCYRLGAPSWLFCVGRISIPLFMFGVACGMHYTSNRKKYLLRLYCANAGAAVLNSVFCCFWGYYIELHILGTIFAAALMIAVLDYVRAGKYKWKMVLAGYLLNEVLSTGLVCVMVKVWKCKDWMCIMLVDLTGNISLSEGCWIFVILASVLYYTMNSKKKLAVAYLGWCFSYVVLCVSSIPYRVFRHIPAGLFKEIVRWAAAFLIRLAPDSRDQYRTLDCRWLVVCALPFMLLYNHKRGRGNKYFFYIFYPAHIYVLYYIGKWFG